MKVGKLLFLYITTIIVLIIIMVKWGIMYILKYPELGTGYITTFLCLFGILAISITYAYIHIQSHGEVARIGRGRYWKYVKGEEK